MQQKKEEAVMLRSQVTAAWRLLWRQFIAFGANRVEVCSKVQRNGSCPGQMPGREEGRRNSEEEQVQDKASQAVGVPVEEEEDAALGDL